MSREESHDADYHRKEIDRLKEENKALRAELENRGFDVGLFLSALAAVRKRKPYQR